MKYTILEAAWILPVTSHPLKNAGILIADNRIETIITNGQAQEIISGNDCIRHNYGQAILVPGFINLHSHLEYTSLQSLSAEGGLFAWLARLMQSSAGWSEDDRIHSIQQGIKEIISAGTTFIVDNSYSGASASAIARSGLRGLIGLELFGVDQSLSDKHWLNWQQRLELVLADRCVEQAHKEGRLDITVAPHAPYTVCPPLWRKAQHWAKNNNKIVLTHLAESVAECQWFGTANGDLERFLIGAFSKTDADFSRLHKEKLAWNKGSCSPVMHLYNHGLLEKNLLAGHAVHVGDEDIDLLREKAVAIAHCPRSNARLGCGRAPLGKMIKSGLKVGLGTDSKASNDDLDLLAEARFAARWHEEHKPSLKMEPKEIIEHLTIKAAACLGRENELGSLKPGKLADIAVFALPENKEYIQRNQDPYDLLLMGKLKMKALFVNGTEISGFQAP